MIKSTTNLIAGAIVGIGIVMALLFWPMIVGICGAISGYGFALLFPGTATALNDLLGVQYGYQSGAMLGFVTGVFTARGK
jgi:hypothetical protein